MERDRLFKILKFIGNYPLTHLDRERLLRKPRELYLSDSRSALESLLRNPELASGLSVLGAIFLTDLHGEQ